MFDRYSIEVRQIPHGFSIDRRRRIGRPGEGWRRIGGVDRISIDSIDVDGCSMDFEACRTVEGRLDADGRMYR